MSEVSAKRMSRSSLYAALAQVWMMGSRFILTPLIISHLGLAGYGTWTLLFGLCSYVSMFHTSFGSAYTKYTAEYDRLGRHEELSAIVSSGVFVVGSVVTLVLGGLWLLRAPVFTLLNVPEAMMVDAGTALALVATSVLIQMSIGGVEFVLWGLQRVDISQRTMILGSSVDFAITIPLLLSGWGLVGLALANVIGMIVATGAAWIAVRRIRPELHIAPWLATRDGLKKVVALGGRFQVLSFVIMSFAVGRKGLISALAGIDALAVFELAEKLVRLASTGAHAVVTPVMPAFASLHAGDEVARARELYRNCMRAVSAVAVLTFGFIVVFATDTIELWTGESYPQAAWTIRLVAVAYYLNLLTGIATSSMRGRGMVGLETRSKVGEVLTFAALCYPAFLLAGYEGLIWAIVIASPWALWLLFRFSRAESMDLFGGSVAPILQPLLVTLPAFALTLGLRFWVVPLATVEDGRVALLLQLSGWGLLFAGLVGASLWKLFLAAPEREFVRGLLRRSGA